MASDDKLIRLQDVPAIVQELRPGFRAVHWCTVYRWCTRGCRGVKLWSTTPGWGRLTHRRAVRDFLVQLDARHDQAAASETTRQLARSQQARSAQLAETGW